MGKKSFYELVVQLEYVNKSLFKNWKKIPIRKWEEKWI